MAMTIAKPQIQPPHAPLSRAWQSSVLANDEGRMWGQTTFKGTRILASTLFEYLAAGQTIDDFLTDFPMERAAVTALLLEIQELLTP